MSASSNDDQVHEQEPKGKSSLFGSTPTSEGLCSPSTSDMGEKLVAVLMDNAVNPFMLFQLVSASARAKHAFEYQPIAYLKISISCLAPDISQLIAAYMVLVDQGSRDTPWWDLEDEWPLTLALGHDCKYCGNSTPCTWSSGFIERYLRPERRLPLQRLSDPFSALKKTATVLESIEQLSYSDLWLVMARKLRYRSPGETLHKISLALWRLEIFCELFGRGWSQRPWESPHGKVTTPTQEQRRFLHAMKESDIEDLISVYDDLSRMLENVYSQDLGLDFEAMYLWFTDKYKRDLWSTEESLAVRSVVKRFAGYIDYRMSLGLGYLCKIYTAYSPDIWPIVAQHCARGDQWTNSFFTAALRGHVHPDFFWIKSTDGRNRNHSICGQSAADARTIRRVRLGRAWAWAWLQHIQTTQLAGSSESGISAIAQYSPRGGSSFRGRCYWTGVQKIMLGAPKVTKSISIVSQTNWWIGFETLLFFSMLSGSVRLSEIRFNSIKDSAQYSTCKQT